MTDTAHPGSYRLTVGWGMTAIGLPFHGSELPLLAGRRHSTRSSNGISAPDPLLPLACVGFRVSRETWFVARQRSGAVANVCAAGRQRRVCCANPTRRG